MWDEEHGLQLIRDLEGGRRELRMQVGPYAVRVTEIPGNSLTDREWQRVVLARRSYTAMWGSGDDILEDDPQDGRGAGAALYDTRHYLAWVRDGSEPGKLVTMRKVSIVASALTEAERANPGALLPIDVKLWKVKTREGRQLPLWDVLKTHLRRSRPQDGHAEFRIAAIGRTGTFPYADREVTQRQRERTGIAFAAIQLLAAHREPNLLYVCSLCPEFRDRVLGVVDVDGVYVPPAFTPTEHVLGLPPGSVTLDTSVPVVREHKAAFPGYFVHNEDAARLLTSLLDEGRISLQDLEPTIERLMEGEAEMGCDPRRLEELAAVVAAADHRRLATILTRPRLFKYLAPRIISDQPLSRMSGAQFRNCMLDATGDGPFSSTLVPRAWAASARAIVAAMEEKYAPPTMAVSTARSRAAERTRAMIS